MEWALTWTCLLIRLILGILLISTGIHRLFKIGPFRQARHYLPVFIFLLRKRWAETFFGILLLIAGLIELFGGVLLIIGGMKHLLAVILSIYFILYALAWSMVSPWWDIRHFGFRLALFITYLVIPERFDILTLTNLCCK